MVATEQLQSGVIKVVFDGPKGTGKTRMADLLKGDHIHGKYVATLGVVVHHYYAHNGKRFNIWDCAGNPKFRGLGNGYHMNGKALVHFYGKNSLDYLIESTYYLGGKPLVIVASQEQRYEYAYHEVLNYATKHFNLYGECEPNCNPLLFLA